MSTRSCHHFPDGIVTGATDREHATEVLHQLREMTEGPQPLVRAREQSGLTLGQAARLAGLTSQALRAAEEKRVPLSEEVLARLAMLYDVESLLP